MGKKALLILNPLAGRKRGEKLINKIIRIFTDHGYEVLLKITAFHGQAIDLCQHCVHEADIVVPIGGDGTLNQVIQGMMNANIFKPIGFIPAGSSNVFSGNLGLPKQILRAAVNVVEGSAIPLDIGFLNDRCFSFITSFGAFSNTSYLTPQKQKNKWGQLAYVFQALKDLPSIKPIHAKVITDEYVFEDDFIFGSFTNSLTVAGIVRLDHSRVDLADGKMEILLIKYPKNAVELSRTLTALRKKEYDPRIIRFHSTANATVFTPKGTEWSIDGECAAWSEPMTITIKQKLINFIG
ncbi:MAG: YegS/Rv2252/BmrU family lipid kinase [Acholeplasmataceae bacterium]|nr:YegS/Rv2252/BmrU family lipid kinase [Acholeplasmataceae bacterium]